MKYLILIAVVVGVLWLMRSLRKPSIPPTQKPGQPQQEEMVTCAQCGVHLPRSEALPGQGGVFCGEAHRKAFESGRSD
jgi:uncharacterized protein